MKRNIIIIFVLILLIFSAFTACELLNGPPERTNPNDDENTLGFNVFMEIDSGLDTININWSYEDMNSYNHRIYYGKDININNAIESGLIESTSMYTIEDVSLEYGVDYHIWLESQDDNGNTYFIMHEVTATECKGMLETDFSNGGIYEFPDPGFSAKRTMDGGNGMFYIAGDYWIAAGQYKHQVYSLNIDGTINTNYAGDGFFDGTDFMSMNPVTALVEYDNTPQIFFDVSGNNNLHYYLDPPGENAWVGSDDMLNPMDALIDSGGNVVVCGSEYNIEESFAVKKLSSNLDTTVESFVIDNDFWFTASSTGSWATSMARSDDGLIYVAGYGLDGGDIAFLAKFSESNIDFLGAFTLPTSWYSAGTNPQVAILPGGDGVVLAAFERLSLFDPDTMQIDLSFGGSGFADKISSMFIASDVKVQPNGKILLVGTNNALDGQLYRFNPDGTIDESFADGGIFEMVDMMFYEVENLSDGHILIAGRSIGGSNFSTAILLE